MKTKNLSLKPLTLALALSPGLVLAESLNNIVVTAQNTVQPLAAVTANMHVINREEIELKQYQNLAQALSSVAGVSVGTSGGLGHQTSVYIRGSNRILVLVNGIPVNDPTSINNLTNFESFSLNDIERIEVVKGGQSGVWGANAAAGVINIITRQSQQPHTAQAQITTGSDGFQQFAANLGVNSEQVDVNVSLSDTNSDGFSQMKPFQKDETNYERDGFNQTDTSFKLGVKPTKNQRIEGFVKQINMQAEYDSSFSGYASDTSSERENSTKIQQISYQVQHKRLNFKAWANQTQIQRNEGGWVSEGQRSEQGGQIKLNYRADDQAQVFMQNSQMTQEDGNNLKLSNQAVGLTNINHFGTFTLTQNIRQDEYNEFDHKTTGKIGAAYQFAAEIRLSANVGTAYTAPSLYQLTYGTTANLKPEETEDWDVRLEAWGLGVTYFNSEVKNLIDYGGSWPSDYYFNRTGTSQFNGYEINYQRNLASIKTDLLLQYTQTNAEDENGVRLARRPENSASIDLTYYGMADTKVHWHTRYIGSKLDYRSGGEQEIGEYFVTDLSIDYALNPHLSLNAKVINLFDEDYTDAVETANGATPSVVYSNGGQRFLLRLSGQF
jgi:vitamin B12 transporter